jgi:RHS repeat-associated protein
MYPTAEWKKDNGVKDSDLTTPDENAVLRFFPTAEGYVKNTSGVYSYVYNYTDHLGNIRLSYGLDENNVLKILEENNYYPFGLKHNNYNVDRRRYEETILGVEIRQCDVCPRGYQYKYNGKELQDELGLNTYDYGARNYDPAIGRWMNIDPLAESSRRFSPYTYALNNPVYFIDPDGMQAIANDDEFLVSPNGNIQQVAKEGEHVVVILNENGERTGVTQNIGNEASLKEINVGDKKAQVLEIGNQELSKEAFKKISDATNVEHSLINYTDANGDGKSAIANQGDPNHVSGSYIAKYNYDVNGNSVNQVIHNHPGDSPPSGYDQQTGEILNYPLGDNRNATDINFKTNNKGEVIMRAVYRAAFKQINRYDDKKVYSGEDY